VASKECRDEITQIDSDSLLVTVEEYLRKHRWALHVHWQHCCILCLLLYRIYKLSTDTHWLRSFFKSRSI